MKILDELDAAIVAPDDIDSVLTTVEQGVIRRASMRIRYLEARLNDLLNDCINFDGGKLTDCIMEEASKALKATVTDGRECKCEYTNAHSVDDQLRCRFCNEPPPESATALDRQPQCECPPGICETRPDCKAGNV